MISATTTITSLVGYTSTIEEVETTTITQTIHVSFYRRQQPTKIYSYEVEQVSPTTSPTPSSGSSLCQNGRTVDGLAADVCVQEPCTT
jgi:hypothetical protein